MLLRIKAGSRKEEKLILSLKVLFLITLFILQFIIII